MSCRANTEALHSSWESSAPPKFIMSPSLSTATQAGPSVPLLFSVSEFILTSLLFLLRFNTAYLTKFKPIWTSWSSSPAQTCWHHLYSLFIVCCEGTYFFISWMHWRKKNTEVLGWTIYCCKSMVKPQCEQQIMSLTSLNAFPSH